jgi:hypothetical protein
MNIIKRIRLNLFDLIGLSHNLNLEFNLGSNLIKILNLNQNLLSLNQIQNRFEFDLKLS